MHIIIEDYQYPAEEVYDVLHEVIPNLKNVRGLVAVDYVGYFYNPALGDCVFILPKVLLDFNKEGKELVFGKYAPEDIIKLEDAGLTQEEHDFIYELSVWIYRSLVVYNDLNPDNDSVRRIETQEMSKGRLCKSNTFLDILLALQKFNRENQDFFFFVLRNLHSGFNKINWTRTISHNTAFMQNDTPVYLNVINKKRKINFDEELLIIFFSILNYMHEKFGFPVSININFPLIKGAMFKNYLNGMGVVRLRQIKYKYFSDKALYLWELCFAFFDRSKKVNVETSEKEYLLVTKYNNVFESIIDELIGEKNPPEGLKEQKDGKKVDHIYRYRDLALTDEEKIDDKTTYYIGDSKYYKRKTPLGEMSVYKQYTYARNVIQWNMDLFNDGKAEDQVGHVKLRDDVTEGYNVIPNFFISALQNDLKMGDGQPRLVDGKEPYFSQRQFDNRLYDRDTFLLAHYDVNFLFVVALYGRNNAGEKSAWKHKVRKMFREEIQKMLREKFEFYAMTAHADVNAPAYLSDHFQQLLGKVFTPFEDRGQQKYYSLALDKAPQFKEENAMLVSQLEDFFHIEKCELGEAPYDKLPEVTPTSDSTKVKAFFPLHFLENYSDRNILIGCYHDKAHLDWIQGKNDKGTLIYNVRLDKTRDGSISKAQLDRYGAQIVVLYEYGKENENKYHVYHVHHNATINEERMKETFYPRTPHGKYYCYVFDEEISIGQLDLNYPRLWLHKDGCREERILRRYAPLSHRQRNNKV